ncbi:MAG: queuosine precursor transporter [Paracoccaceae bacterium]
MNLLPGILAMAVIVTASNILVQFPMGGYLTWGAVTYPFAFLVTDLVNRLQGVAAARRVVLAGFGVGLACSIIGTQIVGEFGPLVTLRIAIGSGLAFLVAQLLDIALFDRMRAQAWWRAPLISTVVGSVLDTGLFFTIAFSAALVWLEPGNDVTWANAATPILGVGPQAPFWVSLALADLCTKLGIAFLALLPFRAIVTKLTARIA